jgi:hypothetical protein
VAIGWILETISCPAVRLIMAHGSLVAVAGAQRRPISRLEPWYALHRPEDEFARELLSSITQYWLFRTHQQRRLGDFVALDRSAARGVPGRCFAIELKGSARLRLGRRGMQLAECDRLVAWFARYPACHVETTIPVVGEPASVLRLLRAKI